MVRRLVASVFLAAFPVVVIPIAFTSMGARAGAAPPAAVQQCKDGGWRTLTDASGQPFKNQGQCISYFIHNPVTLADLASSSTFGGPMLNEVGGGGCAFVFQEFEGPYSGGGPVGTVNLNVSGCLNFPNPTLTYSGSFNMTTNVGSLSGTASGSVIANAELFPNYLLTLTVVTGTGSFEGTTGNLQASLFPNASFTQPLPTAFVGSITVP